MNPKKKIELIICNENAHWVCYTRSTFLIVINVKHFVHFVIENKQNKI